MTGSRRNWSGRWNLFVLFLWELRFVVVEARDKKEKVRWMIWASSKLVVGLSALGWIYCCG
jgi:hypothetical protein